MGRNNNRKQAHRLAHQWPWVVLRGGLALGFGGLALLWPSLTEAPPVLPFAGYAVSDGLCAITMGLRRQPGLPRFGSRAFIEGVASLTFAGMALGFSTRGLFLLMASQALVAGLLRILTLVRWQEAIHGDGIAVVGGLNMIFFGLLFVIAQRASAPLLAWIFAAYLLSSGALMLELARRWRRSVGPPHPHRAPA